MDVVVSLLETYKRRLRDFWSTIPARAYGTHVPSARDDVVRLAAYAPTVSKEAAARLEAKWKAQKALTSDPIDFDQLPP